MRITYDPAADAAYIYLTGEAFVVLDWKEDRLVGIEILDASHRLHPDLLEEAEILS